MTTIAIHQPEYFPWLGFLDKARRVDAFVLLDNVQFDRSSLQHRARVLGPNGVAWMTMPFVHKFPQLIDEVVFSDERWRSKHWKTLQTFYGRAPGFSGAAAPLKAFFDTSWTRLVDATSASVELLFDAFAVRPPKLVRSSDLAARGERGDLVLAICQELGANRYLSGRTGATYLDGATFEAAGIEITVQQPVSLEYPRLRALAPADARGLSALDAWLNLGADAPALFSSSEVSA